MASLLCSNKWNAPKDYASATIGTQFGLSWNLHRWLQGFRICRLRWENSETHHFTSSSNYSHRKVVFQLKYSFLDCKQNKHLIITDSREQISTKAKILHQGTVSRDFYLGFRLRLGPLILSRFFSSYSRRYVKRTRISCVLETDKTHQWCAETMLILHQQLPKFP
jgi:hypothetical protein